MKWSSTVYVHERLIYEEDSNLISKTRTKDKTVQINILKKGKKKIIYEVKGKQLGRPWASFLFLF